MIGSVKTNIGHLEAAAGIAGVIKVILSLEHGVLPQHLHFRNPSPHIPWDRLAVQVVKEATAWERNGRPRIAGVSAFGFAGTNAHVIIEEAPDEVGQVAVAPGPVDQPGDRRFSVLPLSARTPAALVQIADQYRSWLSAHPETTLADVCFTAGVGRAHFEHRAALVVNSTTRQPRQPSYPRTLTTGSDTPGPTSLSAAQRSTAPWRLPSAAAAVRRHGPRSALPSLSSANGVKNRRQERCQERDV